MKLILSVLILAVLGVTTVWAESDICSNYIVCPKKCPHFGQLPMTAIMVPLFTFPDFRANMNSAIDYITQQDGVIKTDKDLLLHTSLNCKSNFRSKHI